MSADVINGHFGADLLAKVKTGAWLDQQHFPPVAYAVPGIIPEGFGLLTGAPKVGKSWATLGIALAVATGGRAFGSIDVGDARPVLLLALEDGDRRMQGRARKLLDGAPIPANLHYATDVTPAEVLELIDQWLGDFGHLRPLVILDTLGKVMPPKAMGETDYMRDYRIGGALKGRVDRHPGATLLAVHHTRKAQSDDWMDSTSGTNGLNGSADFTVSLTRSRDEDRGVLHVTGRDVIGGEYALTVRDGTWALDGDSLAKAAAAAQEARATAGLGDTSAAVVQYVNEHPEGVRADAVADATGTPITTVREYLLRAAARGRIRKIARGLYGPVESVESVESESTNYTHSTHSTPPLEVTPGLCPLHGTPLDGSRCPTCFGEGSPSDHEDGHPHHDGGTP